MTRINADKAKEDNQISLREGTAFKSYGASRTTARQVAPLHRLLISGTAESQAKPNYQAQPNYWRSRITGAAELSGEADLQA